MTKKIILGVAIGIFILLLAIQFISSTGNKGYSYGENDITHVVTVPDSIKKILEPACFDCHSNHTNYLWYSSVQPVGLWIGHHISEGKEHLNFSEFNSYSAKRRARKMNGIAKLVKKNEMPLNSYLWIHTEARLSDEQKQILASWADTNFSILAGDSSAAWSKER